MHNKYRLDASLSPIKGAPNQFQFEFQIFEDVTTVAEPNVDDLFES
jgi:hypothetical protein